MRRQTPVWFHVDVNSAFLSWSALKALREGGAVDLRTIPAVVGGDEEKRHGVVLAKSLPAKQYGIRTGESLFAARAKCPDITVVPPDFDWYVQNSKALIRILNDYSPDVEQYSIDEAFLDMTGTEPLFGPPLAVARALGDRVRDTLGFTVNIGVAPNRLLAKMASDFEKPDKVHRLYPEDLPARFWPLPAGALFGVGPSAARQLSEIGIWTIGDLAHADLAVLRGVFGVRGEVFWNYANGRETEPVTKQGARDNTYGNSVTLPQDLANPAEADATLLALCESVAGRLRMDGRTARVGSVQIVDNAFRRKSHQVTLDDPTNSTDALYHTARALLRQAWPVRPVRLVGVTAERTGTDNYEQLDLFADPARRIKQEKLDRAADAVRAKFGEAAITRAKLLHPDEKTATPRALGAAKARDKRNQK